MASTPWSPVTDAPTSSATPTTIEDPVSVTLQELASTPGIDATLMSFLPLTERLRLRGLCRSFRHAVDASLAILHEISGDDVEALQRHWASISVTKLGGASSSASRDDADASSAAPMCWLLSRCPNLRSLSTLTREQAPLPWLEKDTPRGPWQAPGVNALLSALASRCRHLSSLDLELSVAVTDDGVIALARGCPHLSRLNLTCCYNVTDAAIRAVAAGCPGLTQLVLLGCEGITDASITHVVRDCPRLTLLDVAYCRGVTDASVSLLGDHCGSLEHLNLFGCEGITDASMIRVGAGCPGLTQLVLADNAGITDAGLRAVLAGNGRGTLAHLNVMGCGGVSDASLFALAASSCAPWLRHLDAQRTGVTDAGLRAVVAACPRLATLVVWDHASVAEEPMVFVPGGGPVVEAAHSADSETSSGVSSPHSGRRLSAAQIGGPLHSSGYADVGQRQHANTSSHGSHPGREVGSESRLAEIGSRRGKASSTGRGYDEAGGDVYMSNVLALESLDMSSCFSVTNETLTSIAATCPRLRELRLARCKVVTDASIIAIAEHCPLLEVLGVAECEDVSDASVIIVAERCRSFKALDAACCGRVTDESVSVLARRRSGTLRKLSVSECPGVTDAGVREIADRCRQLRQLNVSGCTGVTDASVCAVGRGCGRLQQLFVAGCGGVTDLGVAALAEGCPFLQHLIVSGCPGVTDEGMGAVASGCGGLQLLDVAECGGVTLEGIRLVGKACKQLHYLYAEECVGMSEGVLRSLVAPNCFVFV
eukprot:jgi/Mesvir1/6001/Mv00749-RA.1